MGWAAALTLVAATVLSGADLYLFSYYSVDYTVGFVRRGLGGELLGLFPDDSYFTGLRILRWASTAAFAASLAAVMWTVATHHGRSERRLLLALMIPALPSGYAFALYSARPDLFGAGAFALFAVALTRSTRERGALIASTMYGLVTAVLALIHEAIPLQFALGAVLAVAALPRQLPNSLKRLCMLVAVAPGLASSLVVALAGRQGVVTELCALVPRRMVENPYAIAKSVEGISDYLTGRERPQTEYHDWMCRIILPLWDWSPSEAARYVINLGIGPLVASAALGTLMLALAVWLIRYTSGVPVRQYVNGLRRWIFWVVVALAVMAPIFVTAFDWTRWLVVITLNVGVVYALFASGQPQIEQPTSRRMLVVCTVIVTSLALLPIGIIPGLAAPPPV